MLNMFRMLIQGGSNMTGTDVARFTHKQSRSYLNHLVHPSSGACDLCVELFRGLHWSGSMCVGVTLWYSCGGLVSVCRLKHYFNLHTDTTPPQPYHNVTPTHIEPDQYNPWNNSTNKSQAPEDGCINIRNMLNIIQRNNKASDIKLVSLYSTIKMMHGPINIR